MERRVHTPTWRPKPGQPFYFKFWDVCACGHLQHYEHAKVWIDWPDGQRPDPESSAPPGSDLWHARQRARVALTGYLGGRSTGRAFREAIAAILDIEPRYASLTLLDATECQSVVDRIEDMKKPPQGRPAAV